ncbi:hypothetical protein Y032_0002g606 [Ancylostoma ceylanicum]|uniref:Secreted protein n=1 Tax=Ancylostoma ceylanicum TaxID=53326 RepID=A0A016VZW5_9BILA|nr:hypothetical protein Y032_0002g606 [Ancylostoma ceylanicum]
MMFTLVVSWLFDWSLDQYWCTGFIGPTFRTLCRLQCLEKLRIHGTYLSKCLINPQKLNEGSEQRNDRTGCQYTYNSPFPGNRCLKTLLFQLPQHEHK